MTALIRRHAESQPVRKDAKNGQSCAGNFRKVLQEVEEGSRLSPEESLLGLGSLMSVAVGPVTEPDGPTEDGKLYITLRSRATSTAERS